MSAPTSASSARILFSESKARLCDRIQVNVNSTGSLAKQIVKGSKSNEVMLYFDAYRKKFCTARILYRQFRNESKAYATYDKSFKSSIR